MKLYRKDIAKIAGVSAQTVSYVLNGSRNFSQETVEKSDGCGAENWL